ncbi:hypothetical protein DKT77_01385 [Meridianimarinicoccus roseus]|uniref:Uncharacterized protein n=1 Tax=Meridianimarinicoccus roseus TaxID=2072018 RepID=A0A2V2LK15_9RHOB|nr:lytic transglycosylase domain-containing protein [Meridianimarinicoccus roseus]PWR04441.1 hypothetical protein DKT77_01385 [Meridianimarinicoccus roseus]
MVKSWAARLRRWALAGLAGCVLVPVAGQAAPGAAQGLCEQAARRAADATGVPLPVLLAVSLTESGRKTGARFGPWPWVLNIAGTGAFFDTRAAALARAQATLARGETSFDMGCFQINYRWHGDAFTSLDQMLDPGANAMYAARFLRELFAETGDWSVAAGHYHSRTPVHADRYRKVFHRHLAALGTGPLPSAPLAALPAQAPAATRGPNLFPLLQPGGAPVSMGSLVPTRPAGSGLFDGRAGRSMWGGG